MNESFVTFYKKTLEKTLLEMEIQRKKILKFTILTIVLSLLLIYCFISTKYNFHEIFYILGFVGLSGGIFSGFFSFNNYSDYQNTFKRKIVTRIIEFIDSSFIYDFNNHIHETEFRRSGIFNTRIDKYTGDDLVKGKLDQTEFMFSELDVRKVDTYRDSKGRRHKRETTIFKGLFFKADFNKNFSGRTIILPDNSEKIFGRLANTFQSLFSTKGELVKLEDPEFEKEFAVFSDSQQEARYILSPALVRKIMDFRTKTGLKTAISFVNSSIYVAIHRNEPFFEPPIFRKIDVFNTASGCYHDIMLGLDIIKEFDLNTRIWTKE